MSRLVLLVVALIAVVYSQSIDHVDNEEPVRRLVKRQTSDSPVNKTTTHFGLGNPADDDTLIGSVTYVVDPTPEDITVYSSKLTYPSGGGDSNYNITAVWTELTYDVGARNTLSISSGGIGLQNVVLNILSDGTRNYGYFTRVYGRPIA